MSAFTKLLVVLVGIVGIFLSGAVTNFVIQTDNWKAAYEDQETIATAAQVQALAAEEAMKQAISRYELLNKQLQESVAMLEKEKSDLMQRYVTAEQARVQSESTSTVAVNTMNSLRQTLDNTSAAQNAVQAKLDTALEDMIVAQSRVTTMTYQLNSLQAERDQLLSLKRRNEEKIYELENEIVRINQQLQEVRLAGRAVEANHDQVSSVTPAATGGVPIRGQITDISGGLAAISVGSSSGVQENMRFNVIRGGKYLGDLVVTLVEPTQSGGKIERQQGTIVVGDYITTGFD
ncbi:MAG: hypothetical protein JW709_08415 [Sedimentisphaerales bacterium]|nr:hypothetical protein [Sedimentisphaerales bacterium]